MKKLIKNIVLFTFPVIICLCIIEYSLRSIPNDYSYKADYLRDNSSKIEVLYLGSSHMFFGANPQHSMYKGFNAAMTSQDVTIDWNIFNKYKKWDKLKAIVIPIDYISLYSNLENGIENWRIKNYVLYYGMNSKGFSNYFELTNGKFSNNFNRLISYYKYGKTSLDCNTWGFGNTYSHLKKNDLKHDAIEASKRHSVDISNKTPLASFTKNTETIEKFIYYAKEHNVKVIFLSMPVTTYYYNQTKNNQLYNTLKYIKNKSKNENCFYADLMLTNSFSDEDFYDSDHLNDLGAKKLTVKIDSFITKTLTK